MSGGRDVCEPWTRKPSGADEATRSSASGTRRRSTDDPAAVDDVRSIHPRLYTPATHQRRATGTAGSGGAYSERGRWTHTATVPSHAAQAAVLLSCSGHLFAEVRREGAGCVGRDTNCSRSRREHCAVGAIQHQPDVGANSRRPHSRRRQPCQSAPEQRRRRRRYGSADTRGQRGGVATAQGGRAASLLRDQPRVVSDEPGPQDEPRHLFTVRRSLLVDRCHPSAQHGLVVSQSTGFAV